MARLTKTAPGSTQVDTLKTVFVWTPLSLLVVLVSPFLALVWILRVRMLEGPAKSRRVSAPAPAKKRARRHTYNHRRPAAAKVLRLISAMVLAAGVLCALVAGVLEGFDAVAPSVTLLAWLAVAWLVPFALAHAVEIASRTRGLLRRRHPSRIFTQG